LQVQCICTRGPAVAFTASHASGPGGTITRPWRKRTIHCSCSQQWLPLLGVRCISAWV